MAKSELYMDQGAIKQCFSPPSKYKRVIYLHFIEIYNIFERRKSTRQVVLFELGIGDLI
jgi:hypothetical protein